MTYWGPLRDLPNKLRAQSRALAPLVSMPSRVTSDDIETARAALQTASEGMEQLMSGELSGCTCRRFDDGDRTYVDYDNKCTHHRSLLMQRDASKKNYDDAHKKLTDDLRVKLVTGMMPAVLAEALRNGIMTSKNTGMNPDEMLTGLVQVVIMFADAAIAELAK